MHPRQMRETFSPVFPRETYSIWERIWKDHPDRQTVQIRLYHRRPKISPLIDDDKDVPTAHQPPIAVLPVPVTISVRVPVGVIPIGIGVDRRAIVRMDDSPVGTAGMVCTIGAVNGRATASVNGSAIASLDCRAISQIHPRSYPSRKLIFLAIRKMRVIEALEKLKTGEG
jgi:hypothetical protein